MTRAGVRDCLVIGGGPAGLTAGIYLGRFRRWVTVVDQGWSRAEWITLSHNLPGFPHGAAGPEFLETVRTQVRMYGAQLETGVVQALERDKDGSFIAVVDGKAMSARTVLLATGVTEIKPPLAHLADAVKRGLIRTCPICDGYEAIRRQVGVLGAGDHAAAEALFLRTFTDKITLLLGVGDTLSEDRRAKLTDAGVKVRHVTVGSVGLTGDGVTAVAVEGGEVHHFDLVYSAFGVMAQTQLARSLQARVDGAGRLFVSEHQETSVQGLYAAGDLVRGLNQISVAQGEAAIAATAIHNRLPPAFA